MKFTGRVDRVRASQMVKAFKEAAKKAARESAEQTRQRIRKDLDRGVAPGGQTQKPNPEGYARTKRGKPPLVRTGKLRDYMVIETSGDTIILKPPTDRQDVLHKLHRKGYRTLFEGFDTQAEQEAQETYDEQTSKVQVRRFIDRGKSK